MLLHLGRGTSPLSVSNRLNVTDIVVFTAGQSLQNEKFSQYSGAGAAAFVSEGELHFNSVNLYNGAVGGSAVRKDTLNTDYWWDTDTVSPGPELTGFYAKVDAQYAQRSSVHAVLWSQGNGDLFDIPGTFSKADYKDSLKKVFDDMRNEIGNHLQIVISKFHRRSSGSEDEGAQAVREAQIELIEENSWIHFGCEFYDLPLRDATHLTQTSYEEMAAREARRMAAIFGQLGPQGTLGPQLGKATLKTDRIEIPIIHDAGTDFTPSTSIENFHIEVDGTPATPDSLTRKDANTVEILLSEGTAPTPLEIVKVICGYGLMVGLTEANVLTDNASNPLPVQTSVQNAIQGDPIQTLDNLAIYFDARGSAKTYASGNNVSSIAAITGTISSADTTGTGYEPVWDDTLFNGAGGFSIPDTSTRLLYTGFTSGSTHTIGMVLKNPASDPSSSQNLLAFSNSSGSTDNQARISMANDGAYYYVLDETSSSAQISPTYSGNEEILILFEFDGTGTLRVYIDDWSSAAYTIDPRDDFTGWDSMTIGARSTADDALTASFGALFHTTDILGASERTNIASYWSARFSV